MCSLQAPGSPVSVPLGACSSTPGPSRVAAVSEVEYGPGPGLHAVRISDAQVRTYAHVVCLAKRRDTRIVRAFFEVIEKKS